MLLCFASVAQLPGKVASGHSGRRLVRPGRLGCLIGHASGCGSAGCLEVVGRLEKAEWFCRGRHPVGRKDGYGPVIGPPPGIGENFQIDRLMLAGIGVEYQVSLAGVIADHNRKVPLGPPAKPKILHHQDWIACCDLGQDTF